MHFAGPVAAQQNRFLTHARDEEIAGVRDLALMADKQPGAGEDALLLLGVDRVVDEDLAADPPGLEIDQPGAVPGTACRHHAHLPDFVVKSSEKERQIFAEQHVLVEDDLAPGDLPAVTVVRASWAAQRIL